MVKFKVDPAAADTYKALKTKRKHKFARRRIIMMMRRWTALHFTSFGIDAHSRGVLCVCFDR